MTQPSSIERVPAPTTGGQLESFPPRGFGPVLASVGVYLTSSEHEIKYVGEEIPEALSHQASMSISLPLDITSQSQLTCTIGMPHSLAFNTFVPFIPLSGMSRRLRFRVKLS